MSKRHTNKKIRALQFAILTSETDDEKINFATKWLLESFDIYYENSIRIPEKAKIAFEVVHKENKDTLSKIWTDKQVEIIKIHRFLEMRWHLKRGEIRGKDKEGKGDRGG